MPHQGRVQVRDPNAGISTITPQARPIDAFRAPALQRPDTNSELLGLAQGLSSLVPALQQYTTQVQQRDDDAAEAENEAAAEEGEALFRRNRVQYAEAVRRGVIPAGANPHLVRQYRISELRNRTMVWGQELQERWASSGVRDSDDPQDYLNFIDENSQALLGEIGEEYNPSEINDGLGPEYDRIINVLQSQHTAYRVNANEARAEQAVANLMTGIIGSYANTAVNPRSDPGRVLRLELGTSLSLEARELIGTGIGGPVVNRIVIDTLIAQAEASGRTDILDVAGEVRTGTGWLDGIREHQSRLNAARTRIVNNNRATENYNFTRLTREQEAAGDRIIGSTMVSALESNGDPNDPLFKEAQGLVAGLVAQGRLDPEVLNSMNAFQRSIANDSVRINEDPRDIADLSVQIDETNPERANAIILGAAAEGRISASTVRSLLGQVRTKRSAPGVFDSRLYRDFETGIYGIILARSGPDPFGSERSRGLAVRAKHYLALLTREWLSEDPTRSTNVEDNVEFHRFLGTTFNDIIDSPIFQVDERTQEAIGEVNRLFPTVPGGLLT